MTGQQLSFDLGARPALRRSDFLVSPGNAVAVAMIDKWQSWPQQRCALIGPKGSGKTHLVHVWAAASGAAMLPATALPRADIADLASAPIAVEDVPQIRTKPAAQTALFHLANLCAANAVPLLLTGATAPGHWGLELPDLASRMTALTVAQLGPPDDTLLSGVLAKLFADRQLSPHPDVIPYLVAHMDRDFATAGHLVEAIDQAALAQKRAITRPLAARVLDSLTPGAT